MLDAGLLAAPGNIEYGSGDVGSFAGEEPEDRGGDFFGLAAALQRNQGLHTIDAGGFAAFGVKAGVDEARPHSIDSNAKMSPL